MAREQRTLEVFVVTYNHERFIAKTLDSILSQQTTFQFVIKVEDDCSADGTIEIVRSYSEKHPDRIEIHVAETNEGPFERARHAFANCTSKYATWLDGDDHWLHAEKLQRQVDLLETDDQLAGCFHDARIESAIDKHSDEERTVNQSQTEYRCYSQSNNYHAEFHPWNLLHRNIIPTASLVFRMKDMRGFFANRKTVMLSLSWAIQLELIKGSYFRYLNEVWSVYNDNPEGISKKEDLSKFKLSNALILTNLLNDPYYSALKKDIYECMAKEYLQILLDPQSLKSTTRAFHTILIKYLHACWKTAVHFSRYYQQHKTSG